MRLFCVLALLPLAAAAAAPPPGLDQPIEPQPPAPAPHDAAQRTESAAASAEPAGLKLSDSLRYQIDPDAYSIISSVKGLSTHKPMYVFPYSYSPQYHGRSQTDVVFQISAKQKLLTLWDNYLYFGYTQKSFWELYNTRDSAPFRSTDYNPELFYRWVPDPVQYKRWGADVGFEHESNGQRFPESRSWNRLYVAPFQAKGRQLFYAKLWWRIPEGSASTAADPTGDDNPNIASYYGYTELTYERQIGGKQLLTGMVRGNLRTGRGAFQATWSVPSSSGAVFWAASLFTGYGESLQEYNRAVTRLSLGVMLSR